MKMIKNVAAALAIFAVTATNAQEADNTTDRSVSFGVKGGVNFSTISGDDFDSPDSRTSFHVGVLAEFPMGDMFSLQTEALYSGQGFEYDVPGVDGEEHVEYQLDYLAVPVLAKFYVTNGFSIEAGPQFAFVVNEELDTNPTDDPGDTDLDNAESFALGIAGGLSFQTEMGLFATGRYVYGLSEVFDNVDSKNSVFQIGLGYKF